MASVPRVCDTLQIEKLSSDRDEYSIRDRQGNELGNVTEEGYFLLLQLDGLTDLQDVRSRLHKRFGKSSSAEQLQAWFDDLQTAGVLNTNERAIRVLTYLREQGVSYRSSGVDRRDDDASKLSDRRVEGRRDDSSAAAAWFDYGIFLLNDGLLDEGLEVFERLTEGQHGDVRLHEILGHLRFLAKTSDLPAIPQDRRDISWDAFDAALRQMLDQGACPRCDLPILVELGATNRCSYCGASFSNYVVTKAQQDRRRPAPDAD